MSKLNSAKQIAHVLLGKFDRKSITSELITEQIQHLKLLPGYDDLNTDELQAMLEDSGLTPLKTQGVSFDPLCWDWKLSNDVDVNYMIVASR